MNPHTAPSGPDFTARDRGPIRVTGSIQPHGMLLALALPDRTTVDLEANAGPVLACETGEALEGPLGELSQPLASGSERPG